MGLSGEERRLLHILCFKRSGRSIRLYKHIWGTRSDAFLLHCHFRHIPAPEMVFLGGIRPLLVAAAHLNYETRYFPIAHRHFHFIPAPAEGEKKKDLHTFCITLWFKRSGIIFLPYKHICTRSNGFPLQCRFHHIPTPGVELFGRGNKILRICSAVPTCLEYELKKCFSFCHRYHSSARGGLLGEEVGRRSLRYEILI